MNVNQLRETLAKAGVDSDKVEAIVADKLEKGEVTAVAEGGMVIPTDALDEAMDVLKKGLGEAASVEPLAASEPDLGDDFDAFFKGLSSDDEGDDITDLLEDLAKGTKLVADETRLQSQVLSRALLALGSQQTALVKGFSAQAEQLQHTTAALDSIQKALGAPMPPRTLSGLTEAIPAPGESLQKGAPAPAMDLYQIQQRCLQELEAMHKGGNIDRNKAYRIHQVIDQIEIGAITPNEAIHHLGFIH